MDVRVSSSLPCARDSSREGAAVAGVLGHLNCSSVYKTICSIGGIHDGVYSISIADFTASTSAASARALGLRFSKFTHQIFSVCSLCWFKSREGSHLPSEIHPSQLVTFVSFLPTRHIAFRYLLSLTELKLFL